MRTETSNPVLSRGDLFTREGTVGFHTAPDGASGAVGTEVPLTAGQAQGAPPVTGLPMTINDVVVKTFILLLVGAVGVGIAWATGFNPVFTFGALIVGTVLAFVNIFKREVSPPLVMAYALFEGVFLGGISAFYQDFVNSGAENGQGTNIVLQAIIGTATAFVVMLALYSSGKLRATPMFKKIMLVGMLSYLAIAVMSLFASFAGVGGGFGFYGVSGIGLLLCLAGVLLAAFCLILDFDAIQKGVEAGAPERESWRGAFGLMVTLVWLYLEILRFLAILQGRD